MRVVFLLIIPMFKYVSMIRLMFKGQVRVTDYLISFRNSHDLLYITYTYLTEIL